MSAKKIVFFLGITWSLNGVGLGSVPVTAILIEFDKVKEQIEQADVEQELKDQALELWLFARTVSLSPHSTSIKMKQLNILKCILLEFPPDERQEPIETVGGIAALLAEGSTAPDKPVRRDLPEVDPPPDACKVEILRLNTDVDEFEALRIRDHGIKGLIFLDGSYANLFLSARASEPPGTFEWSEAHLVGEGDDLHWETFPVPSDSSSPLGNLSTIETGEGIFEIKLTPEAASGADQRFGFAKTARIWVKFTSADGQRECYDEVEISWVG